MKSTIWTSRAPNDCTGADDSLWLEMMQEVLGGGEYIHGIHGIYTHCGRNLHLNHLLVNVYTSALARVVHRTNLPLAKSNESFSCRP